MVNKINLGKVVMTTGGEYDSSKTYERLTCVLYGGESWVSCKDVPAGVAPSTDATYWQKIAERGEQGPQGPAGPQGNSAFDGTGVEIVNNLTQGGESSVLSAEQGKVLDGKLTELSVEISGQTKQEFTFEAGVGMAPWTISYPFSIKKGAFSVRMVDDSGVLSVNNVVLYGYDVNGNTILDGISVPKYFASKTASADIVKIGLYVSGTSVKGSGSIFLEFQGDTISKGIGGDIADLKEQMSAYTSDIASLQGVAVDNERRLNELDFVSGSIDSVGAETDNPVVKRSPFIPCKNGDVISAYIYRAHLYDENKSYIKQDLTNSDGQSIVNYTIPNNCRYIRIIAFNEKAKDVYKNGNKVAYCSPMAFAEDLMSRTFMKGKWANYSYIADDTMISSVMIPVKQGDIFRGNIRECHFFNEDRAYLYGASATVQFTISDASVRYAIVTIAYGDMGVTINGYQIVPYVLNSLASQGYQLSVYPLKSVTLSELTPSEARYASEIKSKIVNDGILGVWIKKPKEGAKYYLTAFRYRQMSNDWGNTEYTQIRVTEKMSDGSQTYYDLIDDRTSQGVNDDLQVFETMDALVYVDWRKTTRGGGFSDVPKSYLELDAITLHKNNTFYLMLLSNSGGTSGGSSSSLDKSSYIAMPIPQLAMVNIVCGNLPTTKTADILGTLEFNGMNGNSFKKNIIINAQGNSSLGLAKKNFSVDIMDENYEESHELKFGDWVAQDGFHLKSYMLDGVRVKPMAAYDIYESILKSRGLVKDRAWKRLQLPSDISATSNDIADSYLQMDDGAKNHPSGFPIIVFHNGVFYGIYCWQLKKHRKNYHQEKKNSAHIHLDGNISNTLLWNANGVLDWEKWSGKTAESASSANYDGIEVRNPKPLILVDGSEYDGDDNRGELISKSSSNYDSSNKDMKRTAEVRTSLELLSSNVARLSAMSKGVEKKAAIADVFDVDSIIDYIIFSQLFCNADGYKKNWQWVTYNGIKWAVNAYDLDGTWGWSSWAYLNPQPAWLHNDTPPITLILENYMDEIKARYAELRKSGVLSLEKIMHPLVNYVKVIGIDYYDLEYEKWTDGARDNLWRFSAWMEESIRLTDILMGFVA